ncbi:MAG: thioether cross-link-forming SCIFF peptide maturase [Lachnospiraceae bacterium]|nr:thioether cross-link-forming SCIFF peptide maturase [Lachnospiraceae bacterium]
MIHQYVNNGYPIVLDVNSGSVHVMDELSYQAVPLLEPVWEAWQEQKESDSGELPEKEQEDGISEKLLEKAAKALRELSGSEEEKREIAEELFALAGANRLYTKDIYKNYIFDFKNRKTVVKALCLHIAHDCNLACKYCFAEEGEYHGRRALMTFEVGKKALDFLVANSGNRVHLEVDFFGGEPLMNWQVVKDLVAYGRSLEEPFHKKFRFTLTTNGVLLNDEILEFCNKEMANIVLSVDGRKEIHDLMRPFRGGQGSYDMVVPKYQKVAESRGQMNYYVRGTFTRNNLDFSKDVLHLADLGFKQISVEPVVAEKTEEYAIREEDIPVILEEYDNLAKEIIRYKKEGKGFNFFHFMIDLEGGPCVAKRLSGCGSGTEYLAVTPWGDFYPCHQFVGQEEFLMGNVDEGILRTDIRDNFKECNVYAKEKCKDCFAKFYCSGGCAANSYNFHGSITDTYEIGCELQRKRIECAIMLKAAEAE